MARIAPERASSTRPVPPLARKRSTTAWASSLRTASCTPRSMVRTSGPAPPRVRSVDDRSCIRSRRGPGSRPHVADQVRAARVADRCDAIRCGTRSRQAEAHDGEALGFGQMPLQPRSGAALPGWQAGARSRPRMRPSCVAVPSLSRTSAGSANSEVLGVVGRDQIAVAVDDVGAPGALWRPGDPLSFGGGRRPTSARDRPGAGRARRTPRRRRRRSGAATARRRQAGVTGHGARPRPWTPAAATGAAA